MSSAAARKGDDKHGPSQKSTAVLLFVTAVDTTWRMFVPTIGGALLGLWLDGQWHTQPWLGIGGLGLGIIVTVFLVKDQFGKVNEDGKRH